MKKNSFEINDNKNSFENIENENEINKFQKSKLFLLCWNKKYYIITCIFIYFLILYLFNSKLLSNTNLNIKSDEEISLIKYNFNSKNLNNIENILKILKPKNLYKGPIFPSDGKITKEWILALINSMKDLNNKKANKEKYIDKIYLLQMLSKVKEIFNEKKEALIDINIPEGKNMTIVGDIHGQFYDLLHIFEINGYPSQDNLYLFNGDFEDRGVFGLECLITLIAFKILYPDYFFMSRGNHEDKELNKRFGFKNEVIDKYKDKIIFDCFTEFYKFLPLGYILNKEVLVTHGGLFSEDGVTLDMLKKINRFQDIPRSGIMCELLWSDPKEENGVSPSMRGAGSFFGPDITDKFLKENRLKLLIRSHEVRMEGFQIEPGGKVITVFSCPNYCDKFGNKGGLIKFKGGDMNPIFINFDASSHPDIPITKYIYE